MNIRRHIQLSVFLQSTKKGFFMSVYIKRSDDGQILFNRVLFVFALDVKLFIKIIVYSPLMFLSWLIMKKLLETTANKILWIALILLFFIAVYYMIYFAKGMLIALKYNGNLFWILLFICSVILTSILPMWILFAPLQTLINRYIETNQQLLTWICSLGFGLYVYNKYYFLTNIAPLKVCPYYQRGLL